jgi:hypothetical protein
MRVPPVSIAPLKAGDFTQVGSASSSTEIAADGQEADIFSNDGVNWPAGGSSAAHDCFAADPVQLTTDSRRRDGG